MKPRSYSLSVGGDASRSGSAAVAVTLAMAHPEAKTIHLLMDNQMAKEIDDLRQG